MDELPGKPGGTPEKPAVFFRDAAEFRAWLERHHATATELWVEMRKAHVPERGLTWADAVPEGLCFGWIDSVSQPIDDDRRRQRWTPRKPGSTWSKINVAHAERLIAEGRMAPAGLAAFEARSAERTGTYSHENDEAELEPNVQAVLDASAAARAFLDAAAPGYRKAVRHWIASAKRPATRIARAEQLVAESESGRLVPFARAGKAPAWLPRAAAAASAHATRSHQVGGRTNAPVSPGLTATSQRKPSGSAKYPE